MKKKPKVPFKTTEGLKRSEHPRIPKNTSDDDNAPDFRAGKMDIGGRWGWHNSNILTMDIKEFLEKIFEHQKLSWYELRNNGSHEVDLNQIIPAARKRLEDIEQDEIAQLYSLRLTGKKRMWGIKENNIFWILWWDPNHE